jgi:hypothetical protein
MLNPWVSLRHDQLIPVYKALNEKEPLEKGLEEEEEKIYIWPVSARIGDAVPWIFGYRMQHDEHWKSGS